MRKRTTALALAACLGLAAAAQAPPPAAAATYTVKQCNALAPDVTDFYFWSPSSGIYAESSAPCWNYARATANSTYANGAWGGYVAVAPAGLTIKGFAASVWTHYRTWGAGPSYPMTFRGDACGNADCSAVDMFMARGAFDNWTGAPLSASWNVTATGGPARHVFLGFRCAHASGNNCNHSGLDMRLRFSDVTYTMDDPTAPVVRSVGGPLTQSGWHRGRVDLALSASDDGGGVATIKVTADSDSNVGEVVAPCWRAREEYTRMAPCPQSHEGTVSVDTAKLADGTRTLTVQASDPARTASAPITRAVRVDNQPPAEPRKLVVTSGAGWRSDRFSVKWEHAAEVDRAPLARSHWRACPVAGGKCVSGQGEVSWVNGLVLPRAGEWDLTVSVEDEAGNGAADDPRRNESEAVRLRYDPDAPEVRFEVQDPDDPVRVSALVGDSVSGLVEGKLHVRREGETEWRSVSAELVGERLAGRLDEMALPEGRYALRAYAVDRAGNVGTGYGPALVSLPARGRSTLRAGAVVRRTVKERVRRGGSTRTVRRRSVRLAGLVRVRRGGRVVLSGALERPSGAPLAGQTLTVSEQPEFGSARTLALAPTGPDGAFRVVVPAERNAVVRISFAGSKTVLPSEQRTVAIRVRAATSLRPSRRRVRGGHAVTFAGQVDTLPAPGAGKLVEIQAHFRGRWRTFQTVRSGQDGRWRFRYRFGATRGRVRYRFRAVLTAEGGYPYTKGASRPVGVWVSG